MRNSSGQFLFVMPVKMALNLMGKEAGSLRPPLTDMEEENRAKLEKAMKEYGIL